MMIGTTVKLVVFTMVVVSLAANQAHADPIISVDPMVLIADSIPPGGSWSGTLTVTNTGDSPLTVSEIGTGMRFCWPHVWLSTSVDELYVLPGEENSVEFEVFIDASEYHLLVLLTGTVYLLSDAANADSLGVLVGAETRDDSYVVEWDLLGTGEGFAPLFPSHPFLLCAASDPPGNECVGLLVSTHGAFGIPNWTRANLDYYMSGLECGTREADERYLESGSPFVLINNGDDYSLTVSNYQSGQAMAHHWVPDEIPEYMDGGWVDGYGSYQWRRTPQLTSADGRIGMQRTYYAPRSPEGHTGYILVRTLAYSADGLPHSGVTIGSVVDWDIPSDVPSLNSSGTSEADGFGGPTPFTYAQGTDTVGSQACQENASRFGAECLYEACYWDRYWGGCLYHLSETPWGAFAAPADMMRDTSLARDGSPLSPPQPDPEAWWDEITAHPGFHSDVQPGNQAIWTVYTHNVDMAAEDTLVFYSVLTSVRSGTVSTLRQRVTSAVLFDAMKFGPCCACCAGLVGDANGSGGDQPTIGDVTAMISFLFLGNEYTIPCMDEADVTQNGGCCSNYPDVTIADITMLIDYLFITGPENMELPPCEW